MGRAKDALQRVRGLLSSAPSDHGRLLRIAGLAREALQYEIGNPLTATRITQLELPPALYAPSRRRSLNGGKSDANRT
jgi:hypothetical protein